MIEAVSSEGPERIHELVLQAAAMRGDHVAIRSRGEELTYAGLVAAVGHLASRLTDLGVRSGDRVVLELEPGAHALALILACSSVGAVFVCLNVDAPGPWLEGVRSRVAPRLRVVEGTGAARSCVTTASLKGGDLIAIGDSAAGKPAIPPTPGLAYLVFTSGSTGSPKAIAMGHAAALVYLSALVDGLAVPAETRIGSLSPLHFDFSLIDLALALASGATLVLLPRRLFSHPRRLLQAIERERVGWLNGVPTLFAEAMRRVPEAVAGCTFLDTALMGGEDLPIAVARQLRELRPGIRIVNCFGHSESIGCSYEDLRAGIEPDARRVSIGRPVGGMEFLLIGEEGREVESPDTPGELLLSGPGLFSGYWQDPTETARVLVEHPISGARAFRTGDVVERARDGRFYFQGRKDFQIQLRGARIEPEEIERRLLEHPAVESAGVALAAGASGPVLAAQVVWRADVEWAEAELIRHSRAGLPSYLVPSRIRRVAQLPRNANGKLDRARLQEGQP